MIPKIIHYCWFGGKPLPPEAKRCIDSWRKFLPDYEIKEWNESNFNVNIIPYTYEAYLLKKYAFVSDYARFYILYHYGGLYFDTDVEIIAPIDDIIARGAFFGYEKGEGDDTHIASGLGIAAEPFHPLYADILNKYNHLHYTTWTGINEETVVGVITKILRTKKISTFCDGIDMVEGIYIYNPEYFCPKNYYTGEMRITDKTVSIHHYSATWVTDGRPFLWRIKKRYNYIKIRALSSLKRFSLNKY